MLSARETANVGLDTYETIRDDIIFGRLMPGEKLKLDALKARYKVSISTLREMLNRLSGEGFVVAQEQRGFSVSPMSEKNLREMADLRILVESHALEMSINNGDTEWEGRIVAAHHKLHLTERQIEAGDKSIKETWKRYDWEFHQTLIHACGSSALLDVHGAIFDKYLRYQMRVNDIRGVETVQSHQELLDAALARDVGLAKLALLHHIETGVEHCLKN